MNKQFLDFTRDLTDDNLHSKVGELLDGISKNYVTSVQTQIMFALYNRIFKDRPETTPSCGACRGRVYNRLKAWYNENNLTD